MKTAILVLFSLMTTNAFAQTTTWFKCAADTDCGKAYGVCGALAAVNKAHLDDFDKDAKTKGAMASCAEPSHEQGAIDQASRVVCVKSECNVERPNKPPMAFSGFAKEPSVTASGYSFKFDNMCAPVELKVTKKCEAGAVGVAHLSAGMAQDVCQTAKSQTVTLNPKDFGCKPKHIKIYNGKLVVYEFDTAAKK